MLSDSADVTGSGTLNLDGFDETIDSLDGLGTIVLGGGTLTVGADNGGASYGSEWGFLVGKTFHKKYLLQLKYAKYDADEFATDTEKLWLTLGLKFSSKVKKES